MKIKSFIAAIALATSLAAPAMAATPTGQFPDVQPTNWAYQAILNLRDRYGVVAGFPDGSFRPGQPATREQLAALVNASLDRITEFQSAADAQLAAALKTQAAEWSGLNARVAKLEVASANKANGVGNYLGAGVLLNQQGIKGNTFSSTRTVAAAAIQGRYIVAKAFSGEFSARPYVNFAAGPNSQIGSAGGLLATYDYSFAKRSGVSAANVYGGVGYQIPFTQYTGANFQSAIGSKGQVVLALGVEGRLSDSIVGYSQLTFPTTTASNSYGRSGGSYSPVWTTGLGVKF
jgi:hypothetical protein